VASKKNTDRHRKKLEAEISTLHQQIASTELNKNVKSPTVYRDDPIGLDSLSATLEEKAEEAATIEVVPTTMGAPPLISQRHAQAVHGRDGKIAVPIPSMHTRARAFSAQTRQARLESFQSKHSSSSGGSNSGSISGSKIDLVPPVTQNITGRSVHHLQESGWRLHKGGEAEAPSQSPSPSATPTHAPAPAPAPAPASAPASAPALAQAAEKSTSPSASTFSAASSSDHDRDEEFEFDKYVKMQRMGLPEGAILQKMRNDGMSETSIEKIFRRGALGTEQSPVQGGEMQQQHQEPETSSHGWSSNSDDDDDNVDEDFVP
jgi:hypothetical protein